MVVVVVVVVVVVAAAHSVKRLKTVAARQFLGVNAKVAAFAE